MLTIRGLGTVLGDLAEMGSMRNGSAISARCGCYPLAGTYMDTRFQQSEKTNTRCIKSKVFRQSKFRGAKMSEGCRNCEADPIYLNTICRKSDGVPDYVDRISEIGNAQFPEWQQQHSPFTRKARSMSQTLSRKPAKKERVYLRISKVLLFRLTATQKASYVRKASL